MDKFLENLFQAEKAISIADHMAYVTFPLIKDKRLLLKILEETRKALALSINSVLQYEYLYKRVALYANPKSNFKTFIEKCAPRYQITESELKIVFELFDLVDKHRESPFEFIKEDRVVILSPGLQPKTVNIEKIKEILMVSKEILRKIGFKLKDNF